MLAEYEPPPHRSGESTRRCANSSSARRRRCRTRTTEGRASSGASRPLSRLPERARVRASAESTGAEMRTHARAVVIGGGVVGVSTLYHLAKKGWTRQRARRAQGADLRLDLACRRPAAAVQPELFRRADRTNIRSRSTARSSGDGAQRRLPARSPTSALRAPATAWTNTAITRASRRRSAGSRSSS